MVRYKDVFTSINYLNCLSYLLFLSTSTFLVSIFNWLCSISSGWDKPVNIKDPISNSPQVKKKIVDGARRCRTRNSKGDFGTLKFG